MIQTEHSSTRLLHWYLGSGNKYLLMNNHALIEQLSSNSLKIENEKRKVLSGEQNFQWGTDLKYCYGNMVYSMYLSAKDVQTIAVMPH